MQAAGGDRPVAGPRPGLLLAVAAAALAIDQATKVLAVELLEPGKAVEVAGAALQWRLERNPGAAFGLFRGAPVAFTVIASAISVGILAIHRRVRGGWNAVALGCVLGGASGNLADRIVRAPGPFRGHVVDFIELPAWPTFNVADMAVVAGAVLLALASIRPPARRPSE